MKEEILTAKEWLEKEGVYNSYIDHSKQGEEIGLIQFSEIMEKYANYKNRILEDRIKEFRDSLLTIKQSLTDYRELDAKEELDLLLQEYDKHFNIQ